jgi:isochorismate hydrolase
MNTERLLAELAKVRAAMPLHRIRRKLKPKCTSERLNARSLKTQSLNMQSMQDFELETVAEALETMVEETGAVIEALEESLFEQALDIYYAAEELARDPEHAHLVEQVEKMRRSYEAEEGRPIPSKEETLARRARGSAATMTGSAQVVQP